jgi:hypothetical protein
MDKKKVSFGNEHSPKTSPRSEIEEEHVLYPCDERIPVPSLAVLMSLVNEVRRSISNFKSVT